MEMDGVFESFKSDKKKISFRRGKILVDMNLLIGIDGRLRLISWRASKRK